MTKLTLIVRVGSPCGRRAVFCGRDAWALQELVTASTQGVTPVERIGPRWSAYVFKLRKAGLSIRTIREAHDGPFPGFHARYVLLTPVFVEANEAEAA